MLTPAPIIPDLAGWTKVGPAYYLPVASIGILKIQPEPGADYVLTVRPEIDGGHDHPQRLAQNLTPEKLAERAQQLYTTQYDAPVKKNTFDS